MAYSRRQPEARPLGLHRTFHWRLVFLIIFFLVMLAAIVVRIFSLAIVEHRRFALAADQQHQRTEVLAPIRGTIFAQDKTGATHPLASEVSLYTLSAVPKNVVDPAAAADKLAPVIHSASADILAKLSKRNDPYEVIAKKLNEDAAAQISELNIAGLTLTQESRRTYPQDSLASPLVGFVSYDDKSGDEAGQYGIERQYDSYLKGERGFFEGDKDASGYWVALGERILNPPIDGDNLVLTIDTNIQYKLESELRSALKQWGAESALGIVLEPKTGRVLALASDPDFNPNNYSQEKNFAVFKDPAVDSQFELGSVFKPITMSAGIEAGVVSATTTYDDPGVVRFGSFTISNFDNQSHGVQTMTQVLEKSLNTGAMFVENRLGKERFLAAVNNFGFGAKTGIDAPSEAAGNISNLSSKRDVDYATASFGQGIAVTPIQMASAIAAIANHGVLMRPYVVDKIVDASGTEETRKPQAVRRVISANTADTVSKMLVSVVDHGFDNRASVKGYFVAGKTGTANIPSPTGRGYSDEVIHTFIGYAPAFDPRFLVLIQLNKPKGNRFASNTLASPFHNIAEFILNYYEVPPDRAEKNNKQ